jgi:NAD+ kinase
MRNLLIVCNPARVDAVVAAVELQQNLASTFGIYTISDVDIPGIIKSTLTELPQLEVAVVLGGDGHAQEVQASRRRGGRGKARFRAQIHRAVYFVARSVQ